MAEFEVETPDGTVFVGPTQAAAILAAKNHLARLKGPTSDGGDLEGVATDLPGGGYTPATPGPYKTLAELPVGMLKSLVRNVLGAAKLNPVSLTSQVMGGPDPTGEVLEKGREALVPASVGEEKAADIEKLLEFFVPGPGKASSLLGTMAKGALETGVIGSAQAGEPNPEAAAGGAVGGAVGHLTGSSLASIARKLLKRAPEQLARVARPDAGYHGEKTIQAAEEALEAGDVAGSILPSAEDLVTRSGARAEGLKGARDAYRAATDASPVDPADLAQQLLDEAQKEVRVGAGGKDYVVDKVRHEQLTKLANEILEARRVPTPPSSFYPPKPRTAAASEGDLTVPLGDMEDKLQAWQGRVYDRVDPTKAPAEEGARLLRGGLEDLSPGDRAGAMGPYSRALELAENLKEAMGREKLKSPSHAGEQFALRGAIAGVGGAVAGAAAGGPGGAGAGGALAAIAAIKISRFLSSPSFQAMSAQQKWNAGQAFIKAAPELEPLVTKAIGQVGAGEHADENEQTAFRYLLQKLNLKTPEAPQ